MTLRNYGLLLFLAVSSGVAHAETLQRVALKTRQDCRAELAVNRAALTKIGMSHRDFVVRCLNTPAGVGTRLFDESSFEIRPTVDAGLAYKRSYRWTPDYLSSPQVGLCGMAVPNVEALLYCHEHDD
jgi:hypothetical protein